MRTKKDKDTKTLKLCRAYSFLIISCVVFSGCAGLRGNAKLLHLAPDYKAPDIVGVLPADNHSNDLAAPDTVLRVASETLTRLGYLTIFSPAQEESLRKIGLTYGGQLSAFEPKQLSSTLGTTSLLYTKIEEFKEINIGFYQNRKVFLTLSLTSGQGKNLWEVEAKATNRAYSLSLKEAGKAFAEGVATSAVQKMLKIHMLEETYMAIGQASLKIPEWPESDPKKLGKLYKEAKKERR